MSSVKRYALFFVVMIAWVALYYLLIHPRLAPKPTETPAPEEQPVETSESDDQADKTDDEQKEEEDTSPTEEESGENITGYGSEVGSPHQFRPCGYASKHQR